MRLLAVTRKSSRCSTGDGDALMERFRFQTPRKCGLCWLVHSCEKSRSKVYMLDVPGDTEVSADVETHVSGEWEKCSINTNQFVKAVSGQQ